MIFEYRRVPEAQPDVARGRPDVAQKLKPSPCTRRLQLPSRHAHTDLSADFRHAALVQAGRHDAAKLKRYAARSLGNKPIQAAEPLQRCHLAVRRVQRLGRSNAGRSCLEIVTCHTAAPASESQPLIPPHTFAGAALQRFN